MPVSENAKKSHGNSKETTIQTTTYRTPVMQNAKALSDQFKVVSLYRESSSLDDEDDEEMYLEIVFKMDRNEAQSYVKENWNKIIEFGNSEQCIKLKEKISIKKRVT